MFRNEAVYMTHVSLCSLFSSGKHITIFIWALIHFWQVGIWQYQCSSVWNFLIKYRAVYLWWNIKYFSLGQRAISSKRHNSPFFGLLKPRWLFIFVMQSDPRSLFTLCFTSLQSPKHHCNCFSNSEIRPLFPFTNTNWVRQQTHTKYFTWSLQSFLNVGHSWSRGIPPLTFPVNNKPLTPSS